MDSSQQRAQGFFHRLKDVASTHPALFDTLLALFVASLTAAMYLSSYGAATALSADNAFPYVVMADTLQRHLSLDSVMWPESPFFFPDGLLTFLSYIATPDVRKAAILFACVQATLVFLAMRWLAVNTMGSASRGRLIWTTWLLIFLAIAITGCRTFGTWFGLFGSYIFVPNNHAGCFLAILCAFALLTDPSSRGLRPRAIALIALCGLTALSDRLFEVQFMLPAIILSLVLWRIHRSRAYLVLGGALSVSVVAFEGLRIAFPSNLMRWYAESLRDAGKPVSLFGGDPNSRVDVAIAAQRTLSDLRELTLADPVVATIFFASLLLLIWVLVAPWRIAPAAADSNHRSTSGDRVLALIALLSALAPLSAGVVLGRHIDISTFRYCMTVLLVPLGIALGVARLSLRWSPKKVSTAIGAAFVLVVLGIFTTASMNFAALRTYNLEQENCFAAAASTHDLKFGVGDYWQGVSMLARQPNKPIIAPIAGDGGPRITMMANLAWFGATARSAAELPTLNFVDEYGFKGDLLDSAYGPPRDRITCPVSSYRVYNAGDGILARMYRTFDWLPNMILTRIRQVTLPAAAWPGRQDFVEGDALHAKGSFPPNTPVLQTLQEFPPGELADAWVEYTLAAGTADAQVSWEIVGLDNFGRPFSALGHGYLAATKNVAHLKLAVEKRPTSTNGLGIIIRAQGDVDLKVLAFHMRLQDERLVRFPRFPVPLTH